MASSAYRDNIRYLQLWLCTRVLWSLDFGGSELWESANSILETAENWVKWIVYNCSRCFVLELTCLFDSEGFNLAPNAQNLKRVPPAILEISWLNARDTPCPKIDTHSSISCIDEYQLSVLEWGLEIGAWTPNLSLFLKITSFSRGKWNLHITEGPIDWQNLFAITRFRYIEVLFHIFKYYWGKENSFVILRTCGIHLILVKAMWPRIDQSSPCLVERKSRNITIMV